MKTDYQTLEVSEDARGVVSLTLDASEKRNALSPELIDELTTFATDIANSKTARVVVLSGKGKVFCAGGDLQWMKAQIDADRATRMREARKLAEMLRALNELPLPLIGKIHGGAFGGGVGMACVCDIAIAADDTKFGLTETRLGLIPATIGPYVLARLGEGNARRVFMSAKIFDASEAKSLGVIADEVSIDQLDQRVEDEVRPYLSAAPHAVAAAKQFARSLGAPIDDAVIDESIARLAETWEGDEALVGIQAFFAKEKAPWIA